MTISPVRDTAAAWQVVDHAQRLTGPRIELTVDRLAEPVRTVARYHFGWCDEAGNTTDEGWGKGLRGALALASAEALDAPAELALDSAVAVELVHNFSVLHDDVMDGDVTRRGRPTAWRVFGKAQAVLAGDALLALAMGVLPPGAMRELTSTLLELVAGQGADLAFEHRTDVGLDECLAMAAGKTASLMAGACALGGLSAGGTPWQVEALRGFGHHLGLAFQLVDDLLGIWGDTATTGKPVGADLRRRKKSLPVVAALSGGTLAAHRLAHLYRGSGPLDDLAVARAADLVEDAGGRAWAELEAARHCQEAVACLLAAGLEPGPARALMSTANLVTHRGH